MPTPNEINKLLSIITTCADIYFSDGKQVPLCLNTGDHQLG